MRAERLTKLNKIKQIFGEITTLEKRFFTEIKFWSLTHKMASASSTSAKNLFQDSKRRLSERVQVNVNNIGSVTRQIMRGSKSQEMLMQTAKNFSQAESTMENTFNNLQKMQVLMAQLNQSQISIENSVSKLPEVQEQIRDMQR